MGFEHTDTGVFELRWSFLLVLLVALLSTAAGAAEDPSSKQGNCPVVEPVPEGPEVDVRAFGAIGDGVQDDTSSIEKAVASLKQGGVVKLGPGTYRHSRVLVIDKPGIAVVGRDATLLAGAPSDAAIFLSGDGSSLRDLTITTTDPGVRGVRNEHSGIAVTGRRNTILRVNVTKSKSAGILAVGAKDFLVACSTVSQTKADGIHMTGAAENGRVLSNSVWNSQDDGIAVVSYREDRQSSGVVIEGNTVEHIRWGRGIAVVGSKDVVIRRNTIRSIAMAAGIIVAREASYDTYGAANVLIEENDISDIQQSLAPLDGGERTGHAAIELNSDNSEPALAVTDIRIISNVIRGSGYDGMRLNGNVTRVSISGNDLYGIEGGKLTVVDAPLGQRIECPANPSDASAQTCAID